MQRIGRNVRAARCPAVSFTQEHQLMTLKASMKIAAPAALCAALAATTVAVPAHAARGRAAVRPLTIGQQASPYVRNFSPFSLTGALSAARAAVLEPLYIVDPTNNGKQTPWLAASYTYSKGNYPAARLGRGG